MRALPSFDSPSRSTALLRKAALPTALLATALLGCGDDKLSGTTGGAGGTTSSTGGTTSSTTGGAGGSTGGAGGMTTSSTGGVGGTGGMTTSSTGGVGGAGGITGGTGGVGGSTGGTGGSGGAPETGTLLVVAGGIPGSLAQVVKHDSAGWSPSSINLQFKKAALAPIDGGVLLVARRLANNPPMGDDDLFSSVWTPAAGFGAVTAMNAVAIDGPALAPHGVATLLATLDASNKHVFAQYESGMFGPFSSVPAGMPGSQSFGPSGAALASAGIASVYIAYAGDDSHLYTSNKPGPGSVWSFAQQAPTSLLVSSQTPALVVASDGVHFFYVRASDGRVCMVTLLTPQNAWTSEEAVHADAITGLSPSAAVLANGDLVVAWHGFDNQGVYFARRSANAWSAPVTVEVAAMSASAPTVVTGLGGADAEVLYTADGKLRWSRITGLVPTPGADPSVANVKTLAALVLP